MSTENTEKVVKTDDQWRAELDPDAYAVLRKAATEAPFTGRYAMTKDAGMYRCAGCGAELFSSDTKFDSGSGWPSFTDPAVADAVDLKEDRSHFMVRTEVTCARCGGHLGHLFDDGPRDKGGKRFCINSCALDLDPEA
jgi:peptide-methionine (R)-S-oxide reductase